jgi:AcrR family transcriptional regulator
MDQSDREPRDLQREILNAARQLFIQHGYHALSMRQIAAAVGVSKPALYYHFRDKEELFLAVILERLEAVVVELDRIQAGGEPARRQVAALVHALLSWPLDERAVIRLASQEMDHLSPAAQDTIQVAYRDQFFEKVRAILAAGITAGELRPVDSEVAAWTLLGMMYPYFYPVHSGDAPLPDSVPHLILAIFLDGLAV